MMYLFDYLITLAPLLNRLSSVVTMSLTALIEINTFLGEQLNIIRIALKYSEVLRSSELNERSTQRTAST